MANSKQAIKRVRQIKRRRELNISQISEMRTYLKKFLKACKQQKKEGLDSLYKTCSRYLDKCAGKGLIHKNKAARLKSRLSVKLKTTTS
ncbi:MAG: 30S ribosomal protein S20 [Legionellales bacterium]|nr:30S ribosomal protein S20 [Legionellales bacterium]